MDLERQFLNTCTSTSLMRTTPTEGWVITVLPTGHGDIDLYVREFPRDYAEVPLEDGDPRGLPCSGLSSTPLSLFPHAGYLYSDSLR
ncbi:hypothetical protein PM082_000632 [Marasmius tenuissimus]|nr:hypothetical protein PM082_000632 [Marasmius tenuissimus]